MPFITFRFDYSSVEEKTTVLKYIEKTFTTYAIADEIAEKTKKLHLQGKVYIRKSIETERRDIKKQCNFLERTNYSMAPIRKAIEEYDSYICKSGNMVLNNIFTIDYILEQVKKHNECVTNYQEKVKKETKLKPSFTKQISIDFKKEFPQQAEFINKFSYQKGKDMDMTESHKELLCFILTRLGSIAKVFDKCILQRMYNGVKFALINDNKETLDNATEFFVNEIEL